MSSAGSGTRDLRRQLLIAAEAEIAEHGVMDVSLRAVARRVGVSHQAPGHHFGNRVGLLTALASDGMARFRTALEQAAADARTATARERLSRVGEAYIHFAEANRALFRLALRSDLDLSNPELLAERAGTWSVLLAAVMGAQAEGWRAGEPAEDVALLCWTVVHGAATAWMDGLLTLQFPHLSLDEIAHTVTEKL